MRFRRFALLLAGSLVVTLLAQAGAASTDSVGGGGDEPCQDPRILGAGCPVCWAVYEPYQIGKLHCNRTQAPG